MKKKIFHNWGLKLASLLLAFILWFLIAKIGDPPDTVTFYNIPVKLVNTELLDKENKVYEILDKTDSVRVTIRAPRSVTSELRASDVIAEADMAKLTEISTIEIAYTVPNARVESVSGDHDSIRLSVEEKASKWIRVQYKTIGDVADDYIVTGATLDQNRIEVSGPKSAVDVISYAGVDVDVTGATTNVSLNVEPKFCDIEGNVLELTSVKKNVSYIHADVEVLATKEVPVELNVMGVPAEGYLATGALETSVETIKIAGRASALAGVTKISVPAEEMNLTGQNADLVNVINIKDFLPDNVRLADSTFSGRITATAFIEAQVEKTFRLKPRDFEILNIPAGYMVEIVEEEENEELVVAGLSTDIAMVTVESLNPIIDIATWMTEENMETLHSGLYELDAKYDLFGTISVKQAPTIKITVGKMEDN